FGEGLGVDIVPRYPAISPTSAPARITHVALSLKRISATSAAANTANATTLNAPSGVVRASRASVMTVTRIAATTPALTPVRNAPVIGLRRIRGISGAVRMTKTNAGRKIPTVASTAPDVPPTR